MTIPGMITPARGWLKLSGYLVTFCGLFSLVLGTYLWVTTLTTKADFGKLWIAADPSVQELMQTAVSALVDCIAKERGLTQASSNAADTSTARLLPSSLMFSALALPPPHSRRAAPPQSRVSPTSSSTTFSPPCSVWSASTPSSSSAPPCSSRTARSGSAIATSTRRQATVGSKGRLPWFPLLLPLGHSRRPNESEPNFLSLLGRLFCCGNLEAEQKRDPLFLSFSDGED